MSNLKNPKFNGTLFHTLKVREFSKESSFRFHPLFLEMLESCLKEWWSYILQTKKEQKKSPIIHYYDLRKYAPKLLKIIELEGG